MTALRLRLATYNVHRCVGLDGRKDVSRVAAVLADLAPDVVALQEAEARREDGIEACQLEELARRLGLTAVHGPTIVAHDGRYGNGLLTRLPVLAVERLDLSFRRREPRGALDVTLDANGHALRVICTHLGLHARERAEQLGRIVAALDAAASAATTVLLGDFNEWRPLGRLLAPLRARFGPSPRLATFPALRPLLPLDRAFVRPREAVRQVSVHASPLARVASDHLPLHVVVDVETQRLAAARTGTS